MSAKERLPNSLALALTGLALGLAGLTVEAAVAPSGVARSIATPKTPQFATPDALRSVTRGLAPSPVASKSQATIGQTSIVKTAPVPTRHAASRAPENDNCADAIAFDLYAGSLVVQAGDNTGATEDCPALSGGTYREAWYRFTTYEKLNVVVRYCGTVPAFYNAYIVLDTTCPCSGAWIFATSWDNTFCGDGDWSLYWNNLPPGTYYWPLLTDSVAGYAEGPYTLHFEATALQGACCYPDGSCAVTFQTDCSGIWLGQNVPCSPDTCKPCAGGCGPGAHFIDSCSPGADDHLPSAALVGIDYDLDCIADTNLIMSGPVTVRRTDPLDDSMQYPGTRRIDGHLDVIDTEIVSMELSGGGITVTAGGGLGQGGVLSRSLGRIAEYTNRPAVGDSFFDVFVEIDLGGGTFVYNRRPLRVRTRITCIPPFHRYIHVIDCVELWTSPTPGEGIIVANLVAPDHDAFPFGACCLPDGSCQTTVTEEDCVLDAGIFLATGTTCYPGLCWPFYCAAGALACDEYISRVQIGTIDHPSGCEEGQYADYTFLSANLPAELEVTNGNPIWPADTCTVWIDWNHDSVFDDDSAENLGDVPGVGPYNFSIAPPANALPGPTRMRIRIDYASGDPDPCGTTLYGEVEDYTVNVPGDPAPGACCWPDGKCTIEWPADCGGDFGGPGTECANADCNSNGVDDSCDVASGYSADCQPNGIPDECDLVGAYTYQHDDGIAEDSIGLTGSGYLACLNHFVVAGNHGRIQNVQIVFGHAPYYTLPEYKPVTVYLWCDPNQDGDPHDAQVLAEVSGVTMTWGPNVFDVFDIPDVDVGPPGTHFFVGVTIYNQAGDYPAAIDESSLAHQSWITADANPIDPNNLGAAGMPLNLIDNYGFPGNWMIRAGADDGRDCNSNGVPDECDPLCVGDLNCDGSINFGDINPFVLYLSNLAAWQAAYPACNCLNGDINHDGTYGQGSFGDINPFVALMVQCASGCPCPGPAARP